MESEILQNLIDRSVSKFMKNCPENIANYTKKTVNNGPIFIKEKESTYTVRFKSMNPKYFIRLK